MKHFDPIANPSLGDAVLAALQKKILSGELKAGDWLPPERDMANDMGVSRGSVHQAVMTLEHQGFVSIVPRKGTVVCDYRKHPTPQSLAVLMNYSSAELDRHIFEDMMAFRIWLETECARLACTNIYESTMQEMRDVIKGIDDEEADLTALTVRFHYLLTQASGNGIYSMIFRACEPAICSLTEKRYSIERTDILQLKERMSHVVDCIRDNKPQDAADTVSAMLRHGIGYLETRYE